MTEKFTNLLENVRIASPCAQNWDEMAGDERARFCGACKLNVYNLSGMSRGEAENLLLRAEGNRLCVRFYRRADGTILTKDCPVGWRAIKQKASRRATAFASLFFTFFGAVGLTRFFAESARTATGIISPIENSIPSGETFQNTNTNTTVVTDRNELEATVGQLTNTKATGWNVGGKAILPVTDKPIKNKRRR